MNWIKLKNVVSILFINILVFGVILGVLEIFSRTFYPEFIGHIHSEELTMGKKQHFSKFGEFTVRSEKNQKNITVDSGKDYVLVFGDSISNGYGHAYNDIWWKKLEELLHDRGLKYEFISVSGFGNNFVDNINNALTLIDNSQEKNAKPKKVIYQFNFNDISPVTRSSLREKNSTHSSWIKFSKWRYEHLNKSTFLRVIQHYAGGWRKNRSGDCVERAYDALGAYTWTYGSQFVSADSEVLWQKFENNVSSFSKFLEQEGIEFEIVVAPILYQVDTLRIHPHNFYLNLDFSCATQKPLERLKKLTTDNGIVLHDPISYLRAQFENRVYDENFVPFYFAGDDNHFTPLASSYVAQFVAANWSDIVGK